MPHDSAGIEVIDERSLTLGPRDAGRVITSDGSYESPLLPGFAVALTGIWP